MRGNKGKESRELYPIGRVPEYIIKKIGKSLTYKYLIGQTKLSGDEWGDIFADAVGGEHLASPLGIADVVYKNMAWSTKTIQHNHPHRESTIRIISGRCSPTYSLGKTERLADPTGTGSGAVDIYNERLNDSKALYEPLRIIILVRNMETLQFSIYETDAVRYNPEEYSWSLNVNDNIEGHEKRTGIHKFTWQDHGAQLTIKYDVPASAQKFTIKAPPVLDFEETMQQIKYNDNWVTIL